MASIILLVEPANGRLLALAGGPAALLVINLLLMRRALAPRADLQITARGSRGEVRLLLPRDGMPR